MSKYIPDEEMRRAAAKLADARITAQPSLDECEHEFSPAFESAMERLMQRGKRRAVWRRVASIAASLLLVPAVSPEARAAVVTWLREQYEDSIIYHFWGGGETSEFPAHRVKWLPEGYELLEETKRERSYTAVYESAVNGDAWFVSQVKYCSLQ